MSNPYAQQGGNGWGNNPQGQQGYGQGPYGAQPQLWAERVQPVRCFKLPESLRRAELIGPLRRFEHAESLR